MNILQLAFAIVCFDPQIAVIDNAQQGLSGIDQLPNVDVACTHHATVCSQYATIRQVQARQIDRRLCLLQRGLGCRQMVFLFDRHISLHAARLAQLLVTRFGTQIGSMHLVVLLLRCRFGPQQIGITLIVALPFFHIDAGFVNRRIGYAHIQRRSTNAAPCGFAVLFGTRQIGLRLRQTQTVFGIFQNDKRVALAYRLIGFEPNLLDKTLHTHILRRYMPTHPRIIGIFHPADMHKLQHCIHNAAHQQYNYNRIVNVNFQF